MSTRSIFKGQAPPYNFPADFGSAGQVLTTDGEGHVDWDSSSATTWTRFQTNLAIQDGVGTSLGSSVFHLYTSDLVNGNANVFYGSYAALTGVPAATSDLVLTYATLPSNQPNSPLAFAVYVIEAAGSAITTGVGRMAAGPSFTITLSTPLAAGNYDLYGFSGSYTSTN